MIQTIVAPSLEHPKYTSVFLAGGIMNCYDWQNEVIKSLEISDISVFNPRQKDFDIADKSSAYKQILWEFERLEKMDIFSMYFCNSESVQPICMYELGRYFVRMQNRFPVDWQNRIIISIEDGYKREQDVIIQIGLCCPDLHIITNSCPKLHAYYIEKAIHRIRK